MRNTRLTVVLTSLLAMAALGLSGCGDDADDKERPVGEDLGGSPIVIGTICSCSGVSASAFSGVLDGANAWVDSVNANGGINGHPLVLVTKDDGSDGTKALQMVKELIEEEEVIAIVGEVSSTDVTWADYAESKGVPVVGGLATNLPFTTNANFFGIGSSVFASSYGLVGLLADAGIDRLALLYCAESPQCAQVVPLTEALGAAAGVEVVYTSKFSQSATDYTAECLGAKEADATALWVASAPSAVVRVADLCAQQGLETTPVQFAEASSSIYLEHESMDGMLGSANVFPWFDDSTPATKEYRDALEEYAPDLVGTEFDNANVAYTWAGGKLFEAAAEAADLGENATSVQVKEGLYALKGETLGGLTPPITYTKDQPTLFNCYFGIAIEDGKFIAPKGLEPQCAPMDVLQTVLAGLAG